MNKFNHIITALGSPAGGPWTIGDDPRLVVTFNAGTQVLVAALNDRVHMTIYQSSWDGIATIQDCTGDVVDVGPPASTPPPATSAGFASTRAGFGAS